MLLNVGCGALKTDSSKDTTAHTRLREMDFRSWLYVTCVFMGGGGLGKCSDEVKTVACHMIANQLEKTSVM